MRRPGEILPYAALAVLIVAATVVTLVLAVYGSPGTAPAAASPAATPVLTAPPRALTDLSANGRLAYWRDDLAGNGYQLWVANTDNSRRRAIAKTAQPSLVSETRWSARGDEVGYVENGVRLVVARVDGVITTYTLAPELRVDGWHIVDHRFSPGGGRVAATVQRSSGSQTDVFLAAAGGTFQRLTTTEDVVAADWISEDELLVNTTAGVLARLRVIGSNQLRPITSLPAATPAIGNDGRIYFLSGRVAGFAGASATRVYAAAASVWSTTVDGGTPRLERSFVDTDSRRLDGFWPGSGFLVRRGGDAAQQIAAPFPIAIPAAVGTVERLRASADGSYAIGISDTNVVRFDLTPSGEIANGIVLLGSATQADVWFPRTMALAQAGPSATSLPAGRYVFALGGSLWMMDASGVPSLLRAGNTNAQTRRRFTLPPPVWSPTGDRVLTIESLGSGSSSFQLVPVVISIDGQVKRYTITPSVAQHVSWSPDGQRFAVVSLAAAASDPAIATTELQIQILDAAGSSVQTIAGREAQWTSAGIVVLTNGTFTAPARAREEQTLALWKDGETRTITTIADLRGDPRTQAPADAKSNTLADRLSADADGTFLSIRLTFLGVSGRTAFAVVRASDGAATVVIASENVEDEAWSPGAASIGYTAGSGAVRRAYVRDAGTGDVLLDEAGRFAGWSADGAWAFIARDTGLYARRIATLGELVRVSPFGVLLGVGR